MRAIIFFYGDGISGLQVDIRRSEIVCEHMQRESIIGLKIGDDDSGIRLLSIRLQALQDCRRICGRSGRQQSQKGRQTEPG
jgi:hypothetical protein